MGARLSVLRNGKSSREDTSACAAAIEDISAPPFTSEEADDLKTLLEKDDVDAMRLLLVRGVQTSAMDAQGSSALVYAMSQEMTRLLVQHGRVDVNTVDSNLWTPLHVAAVYNRVQVVQELLAAGAFMNAQTNTGQTPLILAAWRGYEEVARVLITHGTLLELVDSYHWTALVYAADNGHVAIVQAMLESGAVVDTPSGEDGQTALMRAAWRGHEEIVRALVSRGAAANLTNPVHWTPLLFAAHGAHINIVACLLESGAFVDAWSDTGETALVISAWNGHTEIVRELVKHQASLDLQTSARRTALMGASENGHYDVVTLLLESGAAIDLQSETGATALMLAAWNGHDDVVRVLISQGASMELMDEEQWTPLIYALDGSHESTVKLVLDCGVDANAQCCDGMTPLLFATKNECGKIILRTLFEAGAAIDAVNAKQWTSLMFAVANQDLEAAQTLLECGANANLRSNRGQTALMLAAGKGFTPIVNELVAHGSSLEIADNTNRTALMFSAAHGHVSTLRILLKAGAFFDHKQADDETPFFRAAWNGHEEVAHELLAQGANFRSEDKHGHTALIVSAAKGYLRIVKLLLKLGISVDSQSDDGETALMRAAWGGYIDIVRELIDHGASLELVDNDGRSVLMYAAENGHKEVVEFFLGQGVPVDYETEIGETALLRAAANGQEKMIALLHSNGADLNKKDSNQRSALIYAASRGQTGIVNQLIKSGVIVDQVDKKNLTALMYATAQGHYDTFSLLRACGASLNIISEDEESVMMLAIESGQKNIIYDLLSLKNCMEESVRYLQIGMQLHDAQDAQNAKDTVAQASATATDIAEVEKLCLTMHEAQPMCCHVHQRLADINTQLEAMNKVVYKPLVEKHKVILNHYYGFLLKHGNRLTVSRLVSHKVIFGTCFDMHNQLDELLTTPGLLIPPKVHDWKSFWENDVQTQRSFFNDAIKLKRMVADELAEPEAQKEALTLLLFEHSKCEYQHTEEETEWIHHIFHHVSSISSLKIEAVPSWFIPPHAIEFNAKSSFARGSYGSIHTGYWNGAVVVVKQAFLEDKENRELFINEAEIWFKLQHPNVVQLYRACHVGNPFFVCEYASNGTISDYLYCQQSERETWSKLLQAAVGLMYIHSRHVVHGDLKCNNILVGDDHKAKVTDFGLSFVLREDNSDDPIDLEVGAIRWKAPEVIQCKTRGTFASDVYSFGMCIIEAVTGCLPWGNMPDVAVKHRLLEKRELPKQPQCMNTNQWSLIVKMCAWNPLDRLRMEDVVSTLEELVSKAEE